MTPVSASVVVSGQSVDIEITIPDLVHVEKVYLSAGDVFKQIDGPVSYVYKHIVPEVQGPVSIDVEDEYFGAQSKVVARPGTWRVVAR